MIENIDNVLLVHASPSKKFVLQRIFEICWNYEWLKCILIKPLLLSKAISEKGQSHWNIVLHDIKPITIKPNQIFHLFNKELYYRHDGGGDLGNPGSRKILQIAENSE